MKKVYCSECRFFSERDYVKQGDYMVPTKGDECRSEPKVTMKHRENWWSRPSQTEHWAEPRIRNGNNRCPHFAPK